MFVVVVLFQLHSFGIKPIAWYDFGVPIFFPVVAIQRDHRQAYTVGHFLDLLLITDVSVEVDHLVSVSIFKDCINQIFQDSRHLQFSRMRKNVEFALSNSKYYRNYLHQHSIPIYK